MCFLAVVASLALIAAVDVPFQIWHYRSKLKMSREDLRREAKEQEGDPQIKAALRSQQREMARKRMMAAVPTADVVVVNPTRYAVALRYDEGKMRAPKCWRGCSSCDSSPGMGVPHPRRRPPSRCPLSSIRNIPALRGGIERRRC